MKRLTTIVFFFSCFGFAFLSANVLAQPTISAGSVQANQNTNVVILITVDEFEHVNSFNFQITWDYEGLTLMGFENILPGIYVYGAAPFYTVVMDTADLTLEDSEALFYMQFAVTGAPGTSWPINLSLSSMVANGTEALDAACVSGEVNVIGSVQVPAFNVPDIEGPRLSTVYVPITVESFENINEFQFDVTWQHSGMLTYVGVEDIYPGVTITPPAVGGQTLSASYNGGPLTLPDNTVLFYIA